MQALIRALTGGGESRLDVAALDLATVEFPSLVAGPYLERLDEMGLELGDETAGMNGPQFVARANTYLFEDIGFRGNEGNYYDPRNSCLNWVLDNATLIASRELLEELETRLARPKFNKYVDDSKRRSFTFAPLWKRSNTFGSSSGGIPMPLSATSNWFQPL